MIALVVILVVNSLNESGQMNASHALEKFFNFPSFISKLCLHYIYILDFLLYMYKCKSIFLLRLAPENSVFVPRSIKTKTLSDW